MVASNSIFKVKILTGTGVNTIYLFAGIWSAQLQLGNLRENNLPEGVENPLSSREIEAIDNGTVKLVVSDKHLYLDDTIDVVKRKLITVLSDTIDEISYEEIYLFGQREELLDTANVYQILTQKGRIPLTRERLSQYLLNIYNIDVSTIPVKSVYDYNDLLSLGLESKPQLVNFSIGQRFVTPESTYPFTVNPYDVITFDSILIQSASEITSTTNASLLLDSYPLQNNDIYLCRAATVAAHMEAEGLSVENTMKIYYPFLNEEDITSTEQLSENREILLEKSKKLISTGYQRNSNNINLFYDIWFSRESDLDYKHSGIKSIELLLNPRYQFNLPLDVVFKLLHASEVVPLIKYNPGKRQEKIYRLYTKQVATNGKKIPFLSKSTIFKLMKTIGKMKRVAVYIEADFKGENTPIVCEFDSNASISISFELTKSASIDECASLIKQFCNPVIKEVSKYLSQSGYILNSFDSFYSEEVELIDVQFVSTVSIDKKFDVNKYTGCLSSVFNVIEGNPKKGIEMRYKRVSNYDEMGSQEAFVLELLKKGDSESQVVTKLQDAFQMSQDKALNKMAEVVGSLQVIRSANPNRRIKIKNNPGFLTTVRQELYGTDVTISVSGINDIYYLLTIPIYIDALIRLTQNKTGIQIKSADITKLCKKKTQVKDIEVEEIVAVAEKEYIEQKPIQVEALAFGDEEEEADADMLDLLLGDDDTDDEMEEGEETQIGGADTPEVIKDITGMGLSNPNPFFKRMQTRDPTLFLTQQEGKFSAYSRVCPWNARRQPVILTDEEKARIDKNHPGSYQHAIKYGSSPDKQYWYICPRYWSLKDDTSLTEEEVKSGKYGGIIPQDAKKVPEGKYIFEFVDDKYHKDDGDYVQHYPGFTKDGSHPDGHCLPCCFKQWDSPAQIKRRKECSGSVTKGKEVKEKKKATKQIEMDVDEYIKGPDKFPIDQNRWGYLPLYVAAFLQVDNKKCQISSSNTNLKPNHLCLLRHGVALTQSQSFVACIADLYSEYTVKQRIPTLEEMRKKLSEAVNLDLFVKLQNGTLVSEFLPKEELSQQIESIDYSLYKETKLYRATDIDNMAQKNALGRAIVALNRYKTFLTDSDAVITYTYLWDLCCLSNPQLFPNGMNLVIINVPDDDITGNVQIVCPTNHYSSQIFDPSKRSAIIMKKGDYMEPIYGVEDTKTSFILTRFFSLKSKSLLPNIRRVLETIRDAQNSMCGPMNSVPGAYTFTTAPICAKLVQTLNLYGYTVGKIVVNFSNKAIGVIAERESEKGFIPCFPSSPVSEYTISYMDEESLWQNYSDTMSFLNSVYQRTNGKIPCRPLLRIMENGLIVGLLTETNQFIMVNNPSPPTPDGPKIVSDSNFIEIDRDIFNVSTPDTSRVETMRKIRLETEFYDAFRNTVRVLLNKYENVNIRNEIEKTINSNELLYLDKLKRVDNILRQLCNEYILFTAYSDNDLKNIDTVHTCINSETCSEESFCTMINNRCVLKITESNLISNGSNDKAYYQKMADELIRYSRIKSFVFEPRAFLSFGQLGYKLKTDEVILLQSLLGADYFEDLTPALTNKYVSNASYDNVEPLTSVPYSNVYEPTGEIKENKVCAHVKRALISKKWKSQFPDDSVGIVFDTNPVSCTFDTFLSLLIDNTKNSNITIANLKEVLATKYIEIASTRLNELVGAFIAAGKKRIAASIKNKKVAIEDIVQNEDYYITNLDLILLAQHYKVPLVLFSSTMIVENKKPIMVVYSDRDDAHYYVKSPGVTIDVPNKYKLIVAPKSPKIPTTALGSDLQKSIRTESRKVDLDSILTLFTPKKSVKTAKRLKIVDKV
jgi:hypothetical protein